VPLRRLPKVGQGIQAVPARGRQSHNHAPTSKEPFMDLPPWFGEPGAYNQPDPLI